jgi:hypothetical protein
MYTVYLLGMLDVFRGIEKLDKFSLFGNKLVGLQDDDRNAVKFIPARFSMISNSRINVEGSALCRQGACGDKENKHRTNFVVYLACESLFV